jgi:hypothetical protein
MTCSSKKTCQNLDSRSPRPENQLKGSSSIIFHQKLTTYKTEKNPDIAGMDL